VRLHLSETTRELLRAVIGTGASLGVVGAVGYVLVKRQERREAAFAPTTVPEALPGAPGATPGGPLPSGGAQGAQGVPNALPPLAGPIHLNQAAVPLETGRRYLAAVDVSFPLSLAANASKVRAQAVSMGFSNVIVTTDPPPGPANVARGADYYILGTYTRGPASVARSQAAGQVKVLDAWMVG
jgi:hypothetical protein